MTSSPTSRLHTIVQHQRPDGKVLLTRAAFKPRYHDTQMRKQKRLPTTKPEARTEMGTRNLRNLYFGRASSETEASEDPARFRRTFYDRWGISDQISKPKYFLIVGPKGVGKTAVSEFTRLALESTYGQHAVFADTISLEEVSPGITPLSSITQKLSSEQSSGITDSAWRLFLSIRILKLILRDQSADLAKEPRTQQLFDKLAKSGLGSGDFPGVLRRVRENKLSFSLKGLLGGESSAKDTDEVSVSNLGEALIRLILNTRSENHFILSVDGLDRIISDNPAYWSTLAALLRVADKLHKQFMSAQVDLRIMVMCRSDVFRKISFADADKIAGDSALFIDWGAHQTKPEDSHLWDYLAAKAEITPGELFSMLPDSVTVGERSKTGNPRSIKIAEYLLQFTRSTPREITLLMRRIQEEVPPGGYTTSARVRLAADSFASKRPFNYR